MDKTTGLKECPRCGLRNRRGAYQCDFCGWDFKTASDDWMGQLNDLEKINREVATIDMDTSTMSKIELTMRRPADIPAKERKPEPPVEPAQVTAQDHGDVLAQPVAEVHSVAEPTVDAVTEAAVKEEAQVVAPPAEVSASTVPEARAPARSTVKDESRLTDLLQNRYLLPGGMVTAGLAAYAAGMLMVTSQMVGTVVGWGSAAPASGLMAYGVMRLAPLLKHNGRERETVLCPVCHEVVSDKDPRCPSCGMKFQESSTKE